MGPSEPCEHGGCAFTSRPGDVFSVVVATAALASGRGRRSQPHAGPVTVQQLDASLRQRAFESVNRARGGRDAVLQLEALHRERRYAGGLGKLAAVVACQHAGSLELSPDLKRRHYPPPCFFSRGG